MLSTQTVTSSPREGEPMGTNGGDGQGLTVSGEEVLSIEKKKRQNPNKAVGPDVVRSTVLKLYAEQLYQVWCYILSFVAGSL